MHSTIKPAQRTTLAHPSLPAQYEFLPRYGDDGEISTVTIVHTGRRYRDQYELEPEDARALFRRLETKGYERF